MKNILYSLICVASLVALQGCYSHTREVETTVPASGSSTTVVNPPSGTTTTTTP